MYVFGSIGFFLLAVGSVALLYLIFIKLFLDESIGRRPLLILSVLSILAGVQLISTGILAELIIRVYYKVKDDKPYIIEEKINF